MAPRSGRGPARKKWPTLPALGLKEGRRSRKGSDEKIPQLASAIDGSRTRKRVLLEGYLGRQISIRLAVNMFILDIKFPNKQSVVS